MWALYALAVLAATVAGLALGFMLGQHERRERWRRDVELAVQSAAMLRRGDLNRQDAQRHADRIYDFLAVLREGMPNK